MVDGGVLISPLGPVSIMMTSLAMERCHELEFYGLSEGPSVTGYQF